MMSSWQELRIFTRDSIHWWNLDCSDQGIREASALRKWGRWCLAFFSHQHKHTLEARIGFLLFRAKSVCGISEEQKILIEKATALVKGTLPLEIEKRSIHHKSLLQPYIENDRFYNFPGEKIWWQFLETLQLLFPGALRNPSEENLATWNRVAWKTLARSHSPKVTWLGHASVLVQASGFNILFDPSFHFVFPCFRRHTEAGIPFENLPMIDIVAISHNHGDHFEESTLKRFVPYQPYAFVPEKLDPWFKGVGYKHAEGHRWWSQSVVSKEGHKIKLTAIPAQHGSQTGISDINKTLWMGVMIEVAGKKIYFAGDTAYNPKIFSDIKRKFGKVDLALLPIAPEGEAAVHLDHKEALQTALDLDAKKVIGIHHAAYRTGVEQIEEPLRKFKQAVRSAEFRDLSRRVHLAKLGETVVV